MPTGPASAAPASAQAPESAGFSRTLALQGITFRVSCPNQGSLNQLRIEPEGLLTDNSPMVQEVEGTVTGAEVADLNADGSASSISVASMSPKWAATGSRPCGYEGDSLSRS